MCADRLIGIKAFCMGTKAFFFLMSKHDLVLDITGFKQGRISDRVDEAESGPLEK